MTERDFKVFDGGRPDDEAAILQNLEEMRRALSDKSGKIPTRVKEMNDRLTDDVLAEKYVRFVLLKLRSALPLTAERDWIPALHTLLDVITPTDKVMKLIETATRESSTLYDSPELAKAMRTWRPKRKKNELA